MSYPFAKLHGIHTLHTPAALGTGRMVIQIPLYRPTVYGSTTRANQGESIRPDSRHMNDGKRVELCLYVSLL